MPPPLPPRHNKGFTLVELAIVLVIIALLTSGLLMGITAQRASAENADAQRQLDYIREALLGFAMANGHLPCPAQANLPNTDVNAGVARTPPCDTTLQHGVLPWKTLGLPETDPWGNRFTYFASSQFTPLPASGALASFTLSTGIPPNSTAGLANIEDGSGNKIASFVPAVIVSHGSRSAGAYQSTGTKLPTSADANEASNSNATQTFISRTPSDTFDDLVTWIVPSILKSKMVAAGRLP